MHYVYILQSQVDQSFYVGSTGNLDQRLYKHNTGQSLATKRKKPWTMIYTESFASKRHALQRELKIKSYKGGGAFKKLISPKMQDEV